MWEILAVVVGTILTSLIGLVALYAKGLNVRICRAEEKADRNENELIRLNGKLWSEDKLERTIQSAVDKSFLKWENRMLKKGVIQSDNE